MNSVSGKTMITAYHGVSSSVTMRNYEEFQYSFITNSDISHVH